MDINIILRDESGSADRKLDEILARLKTLQMEADMTVKNIADFQTELQKRNDQLAADVAAQTTVIASAKVLMDGQAANIQALRDELSAAITGGGDPAAMQATLDKFDATLTALEASKADLAANVTANTVAAA